MALVETLGVKTGQVLGAVAGRHHRHGRDAGRCV